MDPKGILDLPKGTVSFGKGLVRTLVVMYILFLFCVESGEEWPDITADNLWETPLTRPPGTIALKGGQEKGVERRRGGGERGGGQAALEKQQQQEQRQREEDKAVREREREEQQRQLEEQRRKKEEEERLVTVVGSFTH